MEQHYTRGYNRGAQAPIVDIKYDDEEFLGVVSISNRPDMRVNVEHDTIILVSQFQPYGSSYLIQGQQYHYGFIDETGIPPKQKFFDQTREWTFVNTVSIANFEVNNHPFVTVTDHYVRKLKLTKRFPFIKQESVSVSVVPTGWYQKPFQTDVEMVPTCGFSVRILHKSDDFREILGQ